MKKNYIHFPLLLVSLSLSLSPSMLSQQRANADQAITVSGWVFPLYPMFPITSIAPTKPNSFLHCLLIRGNQLLCASPNRRRWAKFNCRTKTKHSETKLGDTSRPTKSKFGLPKIKTREVHLGPIQVRFKSSNFGQRLLLLKFVVLLGTYWRTLQEVMELIGNMVRTHYQKEIWAASWSPDIHLQGSSFRSCYGVVTQGLTLLAERNHIVHTRTNICQCNRDGYLGHPGCPVRFKQKPVYKQTSFLNSKELGGVLELPSQLNPDPDPQRR